MLAPREKLWPASLPIVQKALSLLNLTPADRLADYGCGNGIALFTAIEEFHISHAYGYEIYLPRAQELIKEIQDKQLEHKITIKIQNALDASPIEPTAVYLYLISRGLGMILPLLRTIAKHQPNKKLRVVTVLYKIPNVAYDKVEKVYTSDIAMTPIYLYTITPDSGLDTNTIMNNSSSDINTTTGNNISIPSETISISSSNVINTNNDNINDNTITPTDGNSI